MKKITHVLGIIIVLLICISQFMVNICAHSLDYHQGYYSSTATCNQKNLRLRIETTAMNSMLTSAVYYEACSWNDISSGVSVGVAFAVPGMPTSGFYSVNGVAFSDGTHGELLCYDSNGNITSLDGTWQYISININNTAGFFSSAEEAAKTVIHEVGHALKLSHPTATLGLSGHTYQSGLPKAVMNQGYYSSYSRPWVSMTVADHDKSCIIGKWGA